MKIPEKHRHTLLGILGGGLFCVASAATAWSQSAPVLTIMPLGTNTFSVRFTNSIGTSTYDLLTTPMLASPDYPWQWAAIGSPGQTNFIVTSVYPTGFYMAIQDTNSVPLWKAADPNNLSLGVLTVFIDSPANGFNLTQ